MEADTSKVPLDEVAEWRRQGADLRKRLNDRRAVLAAELAEIDRALQELPEAEENESATGPKAINKVANGTGTVQRKAPVHHEELGNLVLRRKSIQTIVDTVLARHPEGMKPAKVVQAVQEIKKSILPRNVYGALNRSKRLRTEGESRNKTYFPLEAEPS
jgi:hypothetical protein